MAKFQGIKIRENAMVYILEIISLADFRHLGLLCGPPASTVLYLERGQKQTFLTHPPHRVHLVIEWPLALMSKNSQTSYSLDSR